MGGRGGRKIVTKLFPGEGVAAKGGCRDFECATARQMSASLIKLDFRPVLRESNIHIQATRKTVEYRKPLLYFRKRFLVYCLILEFLRVSLPSFSLKQIGVKAMQPSLQREERENYSEICVQVGPVTFGRRFLSTPGPSFISTR